MHDQRHLKLREQLLRQLYVATALLHNLLAVKYNGNLISAYFDCWPADDHKTRTM